MRQSLQKGFTLIELMIVLAVLAAVVTLAVPSFDTLIKNNRLYTQANQFYLALSRARSEAMSRVERVTVCASSNGTSCTGTWDQGWIVYVEQSQPHNTTVDTDDGDIILEKQAALTGGNTLKGEADVASYVSYLGTGFTSMVASGFPVQVGTLALCDSRGVNFGRAIRVNAAGRPRVFTTSGDDGHSCDPADP